MTPCAATTPPLTATTVPDSLVQEVDGLCVFDTLDIQLQVHANDSLERKTLSQRFEMPAQLTVMLLLEGDIRFSINGTMYQMSARNGPVGHLWLLTQPGTLVRHTQAGQRVRKVNVTLSLEGVEGIHLPPELRKHICLDAARPGVARWEPSPHALRCAQELLTGHGTRASKHSLHTCIAGLSLFQQALQTTNAQAQPNAPLDSGPLNDRDMDRARKIREHIRACDAHQAPTPHTLARELGMSVSTLQRLFKAAYGMSVMEFTRTERLNAARTLLLQGGLTVGEAGYRAGYTTASNFSTAFQRAFGYPPSACTRR